MTWDNIQNYFLFFIIYAFLGCIVQSIYVQIGNIIRKTDYKSMQFLHLPLIPIYGFGSIFIVLITDFLIDIPQANPFLLFLTCMITCSLLELLTGEALKLIYKKNIWWDYSDHKINFDGQICLTNAILFGLGGMVIVYIVQPNINNLGDNFSRDTINLFFWFFLTIFSIDSIYSSIKNWKITHDPKFPINFNQLEKKYLELEKSFNDIRDEYELKIANITQKILSPEENSENNSDK